MQTINAINTFNCQTKLADTYNKKLTEETTRRTFIVYCNHQHHHNQKSRRRYCRQRRLRATRSRKNRNYSRDLNRQLKQRFLLLQSNSDSKQEIKKKSRRLFLSCVCVSIYFYSPSFIIVWRPQ